jgi:O-6-methylguanine DNA methyltransferase
MRAFSILTRSVEGQFLIRSMRSTHEIAGVRFSVEWRETSPNCWKITGVFSPSSKTTPSLPRSLEPQVADLDTVFRNWAEGIIPKLPLDLLDLESAHLTDKRMTILRTLYETVGRGSVISYEQLGVRSGLGPRAGRAIGNAMARNPWALFYPCHRVVRCDFSIGNYGLGGPKAKETLLKMEGATIRDGICKANC